MIRNISVAAPETPFVIGGVLVAVTAIKKDGGVTANLIKGLAASFLVIVVASATSGTRYSGIVRGIGIVYALAVAMYAANVYKSGSNNALPRKVYQKIGVR